MLTIFEDTVVKMVVKKMYPKIVLNKLIVALTFKKKNALHVIFLKYLKL